MNKFVLPFVAFALLSIGCALAQSNLQYYKIYNLSAKNQNQIGVDNKMISVFVANGIDENAANSKETELCLNANIHSVEFKKDGELKIVLKEQFLSSIKDFLQSKNLTVVTHPSSIDSKLPVDFPKYNDTGNPKEDEARYHEQKQKWIKKHPDEYEKIKHLNLNKY